MIATFLFLFFLALSAPLQAAPAISCHCFRDRSFDPGRPDAADPYLLATTQNAFLSAAFGVDKREIVQAKMTGTSGEDLWIAHFVADRKEGSPAELLAARRKALSWQAALAALGLDPSPLGPRFAGALASGEASAVLAEVAADEVLTTRLETNPKDLVALRSRGGSTRQAILAAFLSRRSDRPAVGLFAEVQAGRKTWGQLLSELGIPAGAIDGEIRRLLR